MNALASARAALGDAQDNIDKITAQLNDTTRQERHHMSDTEYREWRSKAQLAKHRYRIEERNAQETVNRLTAVGDVLYEHFTTFDQLCLLLADLADGDLLEDDEAALVEQYLTVIATVKSMQGQDDEHT
jgi:hypothetical protein